MRAELEFKGGQWQGPYVTMMSAAQQTRDRRLARRAAEMALANKRNDEAQAALGLWRELAPQSDDAFQYYVGLTVLSDRLAEAETLFRRRLQDAPPATRGAVVFQVQQFMSRARDREQGRQAIERLLAPYLDTVEARVVLAQIAAARGKAEEAQEHARQALAIKPDSEIAVLTLAQVLADQDQLDAILAGFVANNPKAREARTAYARLLVGQKRYMEALLDIDKGLALNPEEPEKAYYNRGLANEGLDDVKAAYFDYLRALELAPQWEIPQRELRRFSVVKP